MKRLTTILLSAAVSVTALAQPQLSEKNIDKVLKAMTLEEKAQLLVGSIEGMNYTGVPLPPTGDEAGYQRVPGAAGQTNTIPRLGIPPTVVADGPAGLRITPHRSGDERDYYCTGFPVEILLASSWDTDVLYEVGRAMGEEIREYGVDVILGPATNIMRNPLCGRNFEYYSEDPVLAGKMTSAMVRGVQSQGVGTSVKHFAANNQETNRSENDSRVSRRALREIYLKPFEIAVKEAQPWTIMSSYNKVNGEYSQSNYDLLTKVLREDWGFKGIVMTDWTAPRESEKQIAAGNDLLMPGRKAQIEQIVAAVNEGRLSTQELDACVRRMLQYIVKTPRFQGYKYSEQPDLKAHAAVSRKAAEEGVVLLKNDGALPLSAGNVALFGIQSYEFLHDGIGSGHVNTPYVVNMVDALKAQGFTCNESLAEAYRLHILADKAQWQLSPYGKWPLMEAIGVGAPVYEVGFPDYVYTTTAKESDMALVTIGRKPGEGFDRDIEDDFNLSDVEMRLLKGVCDAFHAAGKKVIVVLNVGGVVETASWKAWPDAILLPWMPGQEGGNVVADVLTGKVNPSGRLPVTFPVRYADVPGAEDYPLGFGPADRFDIIGALLHPWKSPDGNTRNYDYTEYNEGIYVGYRHYQTKGVEVSYPFGFGLSYTSFAYSEPSVKRHGNTYTASIKVTNTGSVAGREVVQLYVTAPAGALDKPERELKAFAKTGKLAPGESQTVKMTFTSYDLASFDESASAFVTEKGTYIARFCTDVRSEQAVSEFAVPSRKEFRVNQALYLSLPALAAESSFNSGWTFWSERDQKHIVVDLPHDAMLHEERNPELPDGDASAYYPGGFYHYEKVLNVPNSWLGKHVTLNFGGAYRRTKVFVNGKEAGGCKNGFIPFEVCLDGFLRSGENTIRVDVDNSAMPNCRWYSGAGLYRDVTLSVQEKEYIEDVRISTVDIHPAKVLVRTRHSGGKVQVDICRNGRTVASAKGDSLELTIPNADLWTAETPSLYTAVVTLKKGWKTLERREVEFGIRQITYGPDGLKINGEPLLLRGGAIHSDNGVLGACDYEDAALRRISILKSYGFNAIRSAHNPASEHILRACDHLGMYVMDELFDGWFLPKNKHDYSEDFMDNYRSDAAAVVNKDFNHPSVLMYSIGNEISEPVLPGGMEVAHTLIEDLHCLDPGRIVTGGINIMILSGTAKGSGLYYKDESAPKNETAEKYQSVNLKAMSSQEFNELMLKLNKLIYNQVLTDYADSVCTPILDALDIAGYNYGNLRYSIEGEKHPGRVIVGSETFPQDVVKNWRDSQRLPYLVGDFLWAAWDYIGEAGIGAWAYGGGEIALSKPYPWRLADIGILDILGNPTGEALLVKALWNDGPMDPLVAVRPVREDVPAKSTWRGTNSLPSWGWRGQDGITATVEVYSNAPSVELLLNGKSLGKRAVEDYTAVWEVPYAPGTLEAVAIYPEEERRSFLSSADGALHLDARIEAHGKLLYIPISLVGENGALESHSDIPVSIEVTGGRLLGFGSANPVSEESFLSATATTYYGKAQAVVERGKGPLSIRISAPGFAPIVLE